MFAMFGLPGQFASFDSLTAEILNGVINGVGLDVLSGTDAGDFAIQVTAAGSGVGLKAVSSATFYPGVFAQSNGQSDLNGAPWLGSSLMATADTDDNAAIWTAAAFNCLGDDGIGVYSEVDKGVGIWGDSEADGTLLKGTGVLGTASAGTLGAAVVGNHSNTAAATIIAMGLGAGVLGYSDTYVGVKGIGLVHHGVWAESDTTSPAKSALHIVPQNANPTVPAEGNVYFNSVTHLPRFYDGTVFREFGGPMFEDVTADRGLTAADHDKTFTNTSAAANVQLFLPATAPLGTRYRMICNNVGAYNFWLTPFAGQTIKRGTSTTVDGIFWNAAKYGAVQVERLETNIWVIVNEAGTAIKDATTGGLF